MSTGDDGPLLKGKACRVYSALHKTSAAACLTPSRGRVRVGVLIDGREYSVVMSPSVAVAYARHILELARRTQCPMPDCKNPAGLFPNELCGDCQKLADVEISAAPLAPADREVEELAEQLKVLVLRLIAESET